MLALNLNTEKIMKTFPELKTSGAGSCNSWVIRNPQKTKQFEVFDRKDAIKAFEAGWTVKTTYKHLITINRYHKMLKT